MEKLKQKLYLRLLNGVINGVKLEVLKAVNKNDLMTISNRIKASTPLVFYHLYGNHKTDLGLISLGLVEKKFLNERYTSHEYILTELGETILKDVA